MYHSIVAVFLLAVAVHHASAQIETKVIVKQAELAGTRQVLFDTINLRVYDINTASKALGDALANIATGAKPYLAPFIADSETSSTAKAASDGLTDAANYLATTVKDWNKNVTSLFNNMFNRVSSQLTANSTSMFDAIISADNAMNTLFTTTKSSYKVECQTKYQPVTLVIADLGTVGFQTFMNAELSAFSRTTLAIADYTNIAADNLLNMATSALYCTSMGLARKDLKARTAACLSSLVDYALPQLNINSQYQVNIVNQLVRLEAGNSLKRMSTGFDSTTTSAIAAANNLSSDVESCLSTGV